MVKTETKYELARVPIDAAKGLGQAVTWPVHFANTLATNAFETALKVVGVSTEDEPYDGEIPAGTSVYDVAKSNVDIAAMIYYYTEIRSEIKKLLRAFAAERGLSPEEDLPVLRDAVREVKRSLAVLGIPPSPEESPSSAAAPKGTAVKDYRESLSKLEGLLERYELTQADKEIMETVRLFTVVSCRVLSCDVCPCAFATFVGACIAFVTTNRASNSREISIVCADSRFRRFTPRSTLRFWNNPRTSRASIATWCDTIASSTPSSASPLAGRNGTARMSKA